MVIQPEREVIALNVNTQQMRYFMELAKCLNFTRAAANLYVAQPTLSQQIAELEAQLGVTLFIRNSRSVTLTPAGVILYQSYPELEAQMEQIQQNMLITAAGFKESLNIGFLDAFMDLMPLIMRQFKNTFPEVAVRPVCGTHNELTTGLKNHTLDAAFTMTQDFATEELGFCDTKLILRDHLCFVLPEELPVTTDFSFAASRPLITFSESTDSCYYPHIRALLKKLDITPPDVIFTDSLSNLRAYLESGMGYTVLPASQASFFSPATHFLHIPGEELEIGVLWDPGSANPALPLFLDALEQYMEQSQA